MLLLRFFDISVSLESAKNHRNRGLHIWRTPWTNKLEKLLNHLLNIGTTWFKHTDTHTNIPVKPPSLHMIVDHFIKGPWSIKQTWELIHLHWAHWYMIQTHTNIVVTPPSRHHPHDSEPYYERTTIQPNEQTNKHEKLFNHIVHIGTRYKHTDTHTHTNIVVTLKDHGPAKQANKETWEVF